MPALLSPAELAAWLGVSPETIRRRIRAGRQPVVEALGITRIQANSAVAQVRARVIRRLPARYRKLKRTDAAQQSTCDDDASASQISQTDE